MTDSSRQKQGQRRSRADVQALVESADGLVDAVIAGLRARGLVTYGWDDIRADGHRGLVEAAHRFDEHAGIPFRAFAQFRVRGAIIDGLRKMGGWSRRGNESIAMMNAVNNAAEGLALQAEEHPATSDVQAHERIRKHMAATATAMILGTFHRASGEHADAEAVDATTDAEGRLVKFQLRGAVLRALAELPPPEDEVLRRFYVAGENMDAIAEQYGKSRSWVSRIHTRGLARLSARLREFSK